MDYTQYPAERVEAQVKNLKEKEIVLKSVPNLVDIVWGDERPARPCQPVTVLEM